MASIQLDRVSKAFRIRFRFAGTLAALFETYERELTGGAKVATTTDTERITASTAATSGRRWPPTSLIIANPGVCESEVRRGHRGQDLAAGIGHAADARGLGPLECRLHGGDGGPSTRPRPAPEL